MKRLYEALFLLEPQECASDWNGVQGKIHGLLERYGCEIKATDLWGDRRLAFEIRKQHRGHYYLVYVECEPTKIAEIRNDAQIMETILRSIITLRTEPLEQLVADVAKYKAAEADESTRRRVSKMATPRPRRDDRDRPYRAPGEGEEFGGFDDDGGGRERRRRRDEDDTGEIPDEIEKERAGGRR